jgi:hypothetical protein
MYLRHGRRVVTVAEIAPGLLKQQGSYYHFGSNRSLHTYSSVQNIAIRTILDSSEDMTIEAETEQ